MIFSSVFDAAVTRLCQSLAAARESISQDAFRYIEATTWPEICSSLREKARKKVRNYNVCNVSNASCPVLQVNDFMLLNLGVNMAC